MVITASALLLGQMESVTAAPIRPTGPFDVCGTIETSEWIPAHFRAGKPGWSGSLGHDVTFPAHFRITLKNYHGVPADGARQVNGYLGAIPQPAIGESVPLRLDVWLNSENPNLIDGATHLCIYGFEVRGDEGGTWTRQTSFSVNK